jgi:putative transposase
MLLTAPPHLSSAKLMEYLKGGPSQGCRRSPELRKRYSGSTYGRRGYCSATAGAVDEETIRRYIENQKWDEDDQGFKITAPTEL